MKGDQGLLVDITESFRSSTVLDNHEEFSTEKRKRGVGAISPSKRALIRTIKNNERVLRRLSQENYSLINYSG